MRLQVTAAPTTADDAGLLQRIAVLANEASTIAEACPRALAEVCAYTRWPVGHTYVIDPRDGDRLESPSIWHLSSDTSSSSRRPRVSSRPSIARCSASSTGTRTGSSR